MSDIVIGDVHGCLDELDELLRLVYAPSRDRLVFVGDLVDRGPDSVGVVRRVRELGATCVLGNHDEWYVRCARHADTERHGGKTNPLRKNEVKYALYEQFSGDDLDWMTKLPLYYRLDEKTVVVHAGMRPGVPVEKQETRYLLRARYLRRTTGEMWNDDSDELLTPAVAAYWTELWTGPDEVIYGHHPSKTDAVFVSKTAFGKWNAERDIHDRGYVRTWGIDTGCCFGNKLTSLVRAETRIQLVSVPARSKHAQWHHSMGEK